MTDYTVAVLEDAIYVLELLRDSRDGLSLAQLTDSSGLVKNKVFRILYTLEKHEIVERLEDGRFRLGLQLLDFGNRVNSGALLIEASRSFMDWLVLETQETIFLGVVSGSDAWCIDTRESPRSVRLFAQVGRRTPLHSGGVPKVLLAFLPADQRHTLLDYFYADEAAEAIIGADRVSLESRLATIREQGFAIVIDELDRGAHSIAAPIFDRDAGVVAAISIAGPSHRFTDDIVLYFIELILDATRRISQSLGYQQNQASLVTGTTDPNPI